MTPSRLLCSYEYARRHVPQDFNLVNVVSAFTTICSYREHSLDFLHSTLWIAEHKLHQSHNTACWGIQYWWISELCVSCYYSELNSAFLKRYFFPHLGSRCRHLPIQLESYNRITIHHWASPYKYVHYLLIYKTCVISPTITSCFAIYDFALWNCSICWLHHRDIRVPFPPRPEFFLFTTRLRPSQAPTQWLPM